MSETTAPANDNGFKLAYSPDEAALALGVGRTTVFALMKDGRLKRVKIGTSTVIPRSSLEDFLAKAVAAA